MSIILDFGTGALEDLKDYRDFVLEDMITGAPELPTKFSLRDQMTPVKNQKNRGTCAGFSGTAILEYFAKVESGEIFDLSEEYLFKRIKEIDMEDYKYDGYGAYLRSAAKAMTKYGTVTEQELPYQADKPEDFWKTLNIDGLDGVFFQTQAYSSVGGYAQAIKTALITTNAPVLTGINLFDNYQEARTTGVLPMPSQNLITGHAMVVTGYDDTTKLFECKNSWNGWGDKGYTYIPYAYPRFMSWSFVDAENPALTKEAKLKILLQKASEYARAAFKKAQDRGIATEATEPLELLTKQDLFVFLDRMDLL